MFKSFFILLMSFVVLSLQAQRETTYLSLEEALKNSEIVYRLDLSHQELTEIPKSISKLKRLKRLDLSHNQLSDLSPILDSLKDLRRLNLNNNQLTELPSKLFQLGNLKKLYLSNNQLTRLPKEIKALKKLKCLELTSNQISTLPEELWELEKVNTLRFDDSLFLELPPSAFSNKKQFINWVTIDRQPDSIDGKPLSFYLNHPAIDPYSKLFVQGEYALDRNRAACVFVDSIFTKNPETAKFYTYLYAVILVDSEDEYPLFEFLYERKIDFLLQQPCFFVAYYQDYLKHLYYKDEGVLDKEELQQIITRLESGCSFLFDNEVDLYFNHLNYFLLESDRKGQIGVRVNDTLEFIRYICLYDSMGKEIGDDYDYPYYNSYIQWFENIWPGKYTLVFYSEEGYEKRKEKNATLLVDSINVILNKELVLKSIHQSLVVEIGSLPIKATQTDILLPPPPPPPPPPPAQVSYVSEEFEVIEVIDEETGEVTEVYIDEERPIDTNYIKEVEAHKDSCLNLFYTTKSETLQLFLEAIYNPVIKKNAISKETLSFLTAIKQHLNGEISSNSEKPNPFDFPLLPSYLMKSKGLSIVLDIKENWSGKPIQLPLRHRKIIRKKVHLYYSNNPLYKTYTINKWSVFDNGCENWINYPLCSITDCLLPAFCSLEKLQLNYEQDTLVDKLLAGKNDCDNIWRNCMVDENQQSFATLKDVPNLYFTVSKSPELRARGVYLKTGDHKLVELWYHEIGYELCGCEH